MIDLTFLGVSSVILAEMCKQEHFKSIMFCVHKDEQLLTFFNFSELLQLCPKLGNFSSKAPSSKYQEKEGKRHIFWQI